MALHGEDDGEEDGDSEGEVAGSLGHGVHPGQGQVRPGQARWEREGSRNTAKTLVENVTIGMQKQKPQCKFFSET